MGQKYTTIARYLDIVAELAGLTVELCAVMEKLFKVGAVEDPVSDRTRVVDDEFVFRRRGLWGGRLNHQGVSLLRRELSKALPGLTILTGRYA